MANHISLADLKALAAAGRSVRLAGREPTLAEMRERRLARIAAAPPPPGYLQGPVYMPEKSGYVVPVEPLDRRRLAAQQKLGLQPSGIARGDAPNPQALVPATYRPLAGLRPNQRGQTVRVDSTKFNAATSSLPAGSPGFFPQTPLLQAKSPGDDAEMLTVTLGYKLDRPVPSAIVGIAFFDTRVSAILTWGVGGAEFSATCDWVNGVQLGLCANYLRVVANVPDNTALAAYADVPAFLLSASVGYGNLPSRPNRARRTIEVDLSTAQTADITIPAFAVGYTIQVQDSAVLPVTCTQKDATQSTSGFSYVNQFTDVTNTSQQSAPAYPIGHGAQTMTVRRGVGAAGVVYVVFDLSF